MQGIGGLLVLLGAGSFALHYLDKEFTLLKWVDNWGPDVGNGIRIALVVVGVALFLLGRKTGGARSESPPA